jgi:predicted transcriptional regulator
MYSKIRREALLDNFKRGQIYRLIVEHPGVHYNRILDELEMNNGTAAFHLKKLEMDDLIISRNDGFRKRFYPSNQSVPNTPTNYEQIVAAIRLHPGITQKEIVKELGIPPSTVNMYIQKMETAGMLETRAAGKTVLCYIN